MYEEITSTSNALIKYVKKLKDASFSKNEGLFLVEGLNSVKDIPSEFVIEYLFFTKKFLTKSLDGKENYLVNEKVMDVITSTSTPSGIVAVVGAKKTVYLDNEDCIVLDSLSDPGNVGTIIRTCCACGIKRIIAIDSASVFTPKVIRASMSGCFKVGIIECTRAEAIEMLKNHKIYCLDMNGENIYSSSFSSPYALVVGNEARGISKMIKDKANKVLSIPMTKDMESLNAAVSCSIALYQIKYGNKN